MRNVLSVAVVLAVCGLSLTAAAQSERGPSSLERVRRGAPQADRDNRPQRDREEIRAEMRRRLAARAGAAQRELAGLRPAPGPVRRFEDGPLAGMEFEVIPRLRGADDELRRRFLDRLNRRAERAESGAEPSPSPGARPERTELRRAEPPAFAGGADVPASASERPSERSHDPSGEAPSERSHQLPRLLPGDPDRRAIDAGRRGFRMGLERRVMRLPRADDRAGRGEAKRGPEGRQLSPALRGNRAEQLRSGRGVEPSARRPDRSARPSDRGPISRADDRRLPRRRSGDPI